MEFVRDVTNQGSKNFVPSPESWKDSPAYQAVVARGPAMLAKVGTKPVLGLLAVANTSMTTEEYDATLEIWLRTAVHPRFKRPYTDLVYLPMQELLACLRDNGFQPATLSRDS